MHETAFRCFKIIKCFTSRQNDKRNSSHQPTQGGSYNVSFISHALHPISDDIGAYKLPCEPFSSNKQLTFIKTPPLLYRYGNEFTKTQQAVSPTRNILFLGSSEFLYVNGALHLKSLDDRRFVVLLTSAKLLNDACLLEFSLKLLQCSFDVLAIFNWYNNHVLSLIFYIVKLIFYSMLLIAAAKLRFIFLTTKIFRRFFTSLKNISLQNQSLFQL